MFDRDRTETEPRQNREMTEIIDYIILWLCYGDSELACRVAYTADISELQTRDVLIVPNGQLGKDIVPPDLTRPIIDNPAKNKYIIRTDIVYNTFFFTSRAEELINPKRDSHGRFLAADSILGYRDRLQIPSLDEHARLVLKLLNAPMPDPGFEHIYLTHDIDSISRYRHIRGTVGGILRRETKQVVQAWTDIHKDPIYTFPWIIEQDSQVAHSEPIYFIKYTRGRGYDYPQYCLHGHDFRQLKQTLLISGAKLGIHSSYYGALPAEHSISHLFRKGAEVGHILHRSHYLRCSIDQMQRIADAGFTDDFTMGFADRAGFRLQTSRAVRWINPQTMTLTNLTLHPLLVMDNTLSQDNYMQLNEDEAYFLCERIVSKVRMHHGDLCLLWHNSSFMTNSYHTSLYTKILQLLHE